jgi:hypothetical protein
MAQWLNEFRSQFSPDRERTYSSDSDPFGLNPQGSRGGRGIGSSNPTRGQYREKTFPETVQVENFVPENLKEGPHEQGAANVLDTAIRMPAYAAERPIALAQTLADGDNGVSSAIPRVPIIGEAIDAVGSIGRNIPRVPGVADAVDAVAGGTSGLFEQTFANANILAAPANLQRSMVWADLGGLDDSDSLPAHLEFMVASQLGGDVAFWNFLPNLLFSPEGHQFLNPGDSITKGEYRELMNEHGYTNEELRALETGEASPLDFAEKNSSSNATPKELLGAQDMANRLVGDPLNIVFAPGAVAGVAAKGTVAATKALMGEKAARGLRSAHKAWFAEPVASRQVQAQRLAAGRTDGVGLLGMSDRIKKSAIVGAGKKSLKGYGVAAMATTLGQVGVNVADQVLPSDFDIVFGGLYDLAAKMGERKPLSQNDAFVLATLMTVPGRSIVGSAWEKTGRRGLNAIHKYAPDTDVARLLEPEVFAQQGPAAARSAAQARFGGPKQWKDYLDQVLKTSFYEKHKVQQQGVLPNLFQIRSRVAAEDTAALFNDMLHAGIRDAMVGRQLGRRDIERGMMAMVDRGGTTTRSTGGLRPSRLVPDDAYNTWKSWEPVQAEMSALWGPKGGAMGVGLQTEVIVDTQLQFMQAQLANAQSLGRKTYTHTEVSDLMRMSPAVLKEGKLAPSFQRALTSTGADDLYDIQKLRDELIAVEKDSKMVVPRDEYYRTAEQWEKHRDLLDADILREGNRIAKDGSPVYNVGTGVNRGNVQLDFATTRVAHATMVEPEATLMSNALRLRGEAETVTNAYAIPKGWADSGIGVERAYDAVVLGTEGRVTYAAPAIIAEITSGRPMSDALTAAVTGMERSGATHGRVLMAGPQVKAHGLVENATEYVYTVGQRNADEWDTIMRYLAGFKENVRAIDTGEGVVTLAIRDDSSLLKKLGQTEKRLGKPTEERVHIADIFASKRKSDPANGRYSLKQLSNELQSTDPRYFDAKLYIDRYRGATRGGGEYTRALREVEKREQKALAARGHGASGNGRSGSTLTRFEQQRGTGATGGTKEYALDVSKTQNKSKWERLLNDQAGLRDTSGGRFEFRPGDLLFRSRKSGRRTGAVVRDNGELIVFDRNPGAGRKPDDWGDVLAEASEHATWTRGIDPWVADGAEAAVGGLRKLDVTARAQSAQHGSMTWVDELAEHGFWPSYRGKGGESAEDMLYLVRDVDGTVMGGSQFNRGQYLDRINELDVIEMSMPQARVSAEALGSMMSPQQAARMRQALRDRAIMEGVAPRSAWTERRRSQIINETLNKGRVRYVKRAEEDAARIVPNFEEGVLEYLASGRVPQETIEGVIKLENKLRQSGALIDESGNLIPSAGYTAKILPQNAAPYYRGQNEMYDVVMQGKQAADTHFRQATAKMSQMLDNVVGSRYAVELGGQQRQAMLDEFVNAGATVGEVNRFISTLGRVLETAPGWGGAKWYRSIEKLPPGTIREIANGDYALSKTLFTGFSDEVLENVGDVAALMQRSGSRVYRGLEQKFPAKEGQGNLGALIERTYGKQHLGGMADVGLAGARKGAWAAGVAYNVWRFLLDPRWWAMNLAEGDILGMARWGEKVRGIGGGGARPGGLKGLIDTSKGKTGVKTNKNVELLSGRRADQSMLSIEESLKADRAASGWMDPRAMYGYVSEAVNVTKEGVTAKTLQKMVDDGSPVIDDLKKLWGDDPKKWVDEIDDLLFSIDNKGVKSTIMADETAKLMASQDNPYYAAFLQNMYKQHTKNYKDIVHTFHGNVNRSNLERLFNSPFLWWPLSYQLKTGKWLLDVMTKSFVGLKPELAGSAALFKVLEGHKWSMENNDEYRSMMEEHPAAFQALGMFLPITPFDLGVFMGRWTRYSGNWVGAQLGLNDPDPSYPQDPTNFITRSLSLGPVYSKSVFDRIAREFEE